MENNNNLSNELTPKRNLDFNKSNIKKRIKRESNDKDNDHNDDEEYNEEGKKGGKKRITFAELQEIKRKKEEKENKKEKKVKKKGEDVSFTYAVLGIVGLISFFLILIGLVLFLARPNKNDNPSLNYNDDRTTSPNKRKCIRLNGRIVCEDEDKNKNPSQKRKCIKYNGRIVCEDPEYDEEDEDPQTEAPIQQHFNTNWNMNINRKNEKTKKQQGHPLNKFSEEISRKKENVYDYNLSEEQPKEDKKEKEEEKKVDKPGENDQTKNKEENKKEKEENTEQVVTEDEETLEKIRLLEKEIEKNEEELNMLLDMPYTPHKNLNFSDILPKFNKKFLVFIPSEAIDDSKGKHGHLDELLDKFVDLIIEDKNFETQKRSIKFIVFNSNMQSNKYFLEMKEKMHGTKQDDEEKVWYSKFEYFVDFLDFNDLVIDKNNVMETSDKFYPFSYYLYHILKYSASHNSRYTVVLSPIATICPQTFSNLNHLVELSQGLVNDWEIMRTSLYNFGKVFNTKNVNPFISHLRQNLHLGEDILKTYIKKNPNSYITSKKVLFVAKHNHLFESEEKPQCDNLIFNFDSLPIEQWFKPVFCPKDIIWPCQFKEGTIKPVLAVNSKQFEPTKNNIQVDDNKSSNKSLDNKVVEDDPESTNHPQKNNPLHLHRQKIKSLLNKRSQSHHELSDDEKLFVRLLDSHRG